METYELAKWRVAVRPKSSTTLGGCIKCKADYAQQHHVTYTPSKIELLCDYCHGNITYLNMIASRYILGRVLSNHEREYINDFFLSELSTKEATVLKNFAVAMQKLIISHYLTHGRCI
jgi:hypothetical protein